MPALVAALCGLLGLAAGSLVNVVVARNSHEVVVPLRRGGGQGRLRSVPVLWWFADRRPDASWQEPAVELATGVVWAALGARFATDPALPAFLVFGACLVAVSVVDLREYRIPRRIVFPSAGAGLALLGVAALVDADPDPLVAAVAGAAGAFVFLLVFALVAPSGMGMGDVWLQLVTGLFLGWVGLPLVIVGLLVGSAAGALAGLGFWVVRRRSAEYPFGPYLAVGALVTVLASEALL